MEVLTLTIACREGRPPADDIFAYSCCPEPVPFRRSFALVSADMHAHQAAGAGARESSGS
jgi:hypothetical protein